MASELFSGPLKGVVDLDKALLEPRGPKYATLRRLGIAKSATLSKQHLNVIQASPIAANDLLSKRQ
jgi:hypothetical protein